MLLVRWRGSHHPAIPQINKVTKPISHSTLGAWKLDFLNQCVPLCRNWRLAAGLWDAVVCRHKQCWWLSPFYLLWGPTAWSQPSEELRWSQEPPPVICPVSPWCLNVNKRRGGYFCHRWRMRAQRWLVLPSRVRLVSRLLAEACSSSSWFSMLLSANRWLFNHSSYSCFSRTWYILHNIELINFDFFFHCADSSINYF